MFAFTLSAGNIYAIIFFIRKHFHVHKKPDEKE